MAVAAAVTDEEREFLVQSFMKLTNAQIREFLRAKRLAVSGTKEELQSRIDDVHWRME